MDLIKDNYIAQLEFFYYDETSPTCLRWAKKPSANSRAIGSVQGTVSKKYPTVTVHKTSLYCHVIVWLLHKKDIPYGTLIDHIDRNKHNPRISNLRLLSKSLNALNTNDTQKKGIVKVSENYYKVNIGHLTIGQWGSLELQVQAKERYLVNLGVLSFDQAKYSQIYPKLDSCKLEYLSKTGFKGVESLSSGKFRQRICIAGKQYGLGTFDTAEQAQDQYLRKCIELGRIAV